MRTVLVAGIPRSGTSWVGQVLSRTAGAAYVNEPDNENQAFAFRAKIGLGLFPVLQPGDDAALYARLWDHAFGYGGRRTGMAEAVGRARSRISYDILKLIRKKQREELDAALRHTAPSVSARVRVAAALSVPKEPEPPYDRVVVKSVHSALALEWIANRWNPRILVVFRDPLETIASWIKIGIPRDRRLDQHGLVRERLLDRWGVALPDPSSSPLERLAWQFGVLTCALQDATARHPDWRVVTHEQLYAAPDSAFPALARELDLRWSDEAAAFVAASNRPGAGYHTNRTATDLVESWRKVLDEEEARSVRGVLSRFPLRDPAALGAAAPYRRSERS